MMTLTHTDWLIDLREARDPRFVARSVASPSPALFQRLRERTTAGLIVFSSGTTGEPKAAVFDFNVLLKRYRAPRQAYRTLLFLNVDHLGGVNTLLHALSCGSTAIVCNERSPNAVSRTIARHRVDVLPTTPTFLRMLVVSGVYTEHDLSSLRRITYGTEPMPSPTLKHLNALFPKVEFKQTYGLTELGVLPTRSKRGDSLWLKVGGVGCETKVVDGILWIRSETAMLGYLNAPSPFDRNGWYDTGDRVHVNGDFVHILGRENDVINVGGEKVHPVEVENVLLDMDNIRDATVWGRANAVTGQVVAAQVMLASEESLRSVEERIDAFCRNRLASYKVPMHVELVSDNPMGHRFKKLRPAAAR